MTSSKMSRKRIGQALGLLALGLVLLVGSANTYRTVAQQEQETAVFYVEGVVNARGGMEVRLPIPGSVQLSVRFVVRGDTNPHSLVAAGTKVDIFGHAKEGVPEFRTVNDLASLSLYATVPKPASGAETLAGQQQAAVTTLHVALSSFIISSAPGGTTVSPNNPDRKTLLETLKNCIVIAARGDVQIKRSGEDSWQPLKRGDKVQHGDEIKSGARSAAVITCDHGWVIRIHPNAQGQFVGDPAPLDIPPAGLRVFKGATYNRIPPPPPGYTPLVPPGRVMTPHGTAAVRGTLFKVGHDPQAPLSEVVVVKGTVEIETLPTGKNKMTLTGPGSCEQGGLRVTIDKDENISQPEAVTIDRAEWKFSGIDLCAMGG